VPTTEKLLHYKFKFDFMRNAVSAPQPDSRMTADFSLQIVDKPK
jgi:hypothetical protein